MASRVVITDAHVPVGQAIFKAFEATHFSVLAPRRSALDWTDEAQVAEYLDTHAPEVIINTQGWSEFPTSKQQARLTGSAEVLAKVCRARSVAVIQLSSFRVFGGENKSSYDEQDRPSPLGAAGRAFWAAERSLQMGLERYICLRVGWLLDGRSDTLFRRLLEGLLSDAPCQVSALRSGAPIGVGPLAKVVLAMVNQIHCGADNWGVMHYASADVCTVKELAAVIREHLEALPGDLALQECLEIGEADTEAALLREPVSAVLSMRRCRDDFGVQARSWRQGLGTLVAHYVELQAAAVA